MDTRELIIWYKDGTTRMVNEHKLKSKHVDRTHVKLILCPDLYRPNLFIPIKPNKLWLAHRFIGRVEMQSALLDFEEQLISPLVDIPSTIDTTSLVEFVYYLTSVYRANGFTDLITSAVDDFNTCTYAFYPVKYNFKFLDASNDTISDISSGQLEFLKSDTYLEQGLIDFICKGRLKPLRKLLYEVECGDTFEATISKLPKGILISEGMAYDVKKPGQLPEDSIILYRIYGFESYMVLTPKSVANLLKQLPMYLNLGVHSRTQDDRSYFASSSDRVIKERFAEIAVNHDLNIDEFVIFMGMRFSDYSEYLGFMMYLQEFLEYLKVIVLYLIDENDPQMPQVIAHIACIDHNVTSDVFLDKEISDGKLYSKMLHYLIH